MRGTHRNSGEPASEGPSELGPREVGWGRSLPASRGTDEMHGASEAMRRVRSQIALLGPLPSTVLLAGETGVGKGLAARALHRASGIRPGPFVHLDCASLTPNLIESELFGHERGAFTGALVRRAGCFERAEAGTLFLDEVGELEPCHQSRLLRVLEDREFERIGGTATLRMRARVVAATSRDLRREVREGRFRSDLFFRLDVLRLGIPPLRERCEDIPDLVREGARELSTRLGRPLPIVSDSLCTALSRRAWPGNVRELLNAVERLLILRPGAYLDEEALVGLLDEAEEPCRTMRNSSAGVTGEGRVRIETVLREAGGNVARAARTLGVPRTTLRRRIRSYGLSAMLVTGGQESPSPP
jgi:DNA-binding NtrC family response regulator